MLSGLLAIHKLGFVYGDLKPENLLVCREKVRRQAMIFFLRTKELIYVLFCSE